MSLATQTPEPKPSYLEPLHKSFSTPDPCFQQTPDPPPLPLEKPENDAKIGPDHSGLEPIAASVSAVPVLGVLELDSISMLQLRGAGAEDRQGLLTDMENMEIAWEDFILEEPNTTKAFVQPKTARYQ